jgi:isopentenyl-diphosphate delta-isomerase
MTNHIQGRKSDHIRINLEKDVLSGVTNGLEEFSLEHCALPELSLNEIKTDAHFLGFSLIIPLLISSMTGGNDESWKINKNLAMAAEKKGVAIGLGSQRPMLEHPDLAYSFKIRPFAPTIPIFGNLGAVQFNNGVSIDDCKRLVESIDANGLILHLNPLQEALQPEGEINFSGLLRKIGQLCKEANFPILVKEVGWGISGTIAKRLIEAGVAAIDAAGAGGTSWSQVEAYRIADERMKRIALEFREWGLPTAKSIREIREIDKKIPLIASGGIRNGIEMAKCIALGANLCGMAGRMLKAASVSSNAAMKEIDDIEKELRIAMFAAGMKDIASLSKCKLIETKVRI